MFDFEIEQRLPLGVTLALEVPPVLAPSFRGPFVRIGRRPADEVRIVLPALPVVRFAKVRLAEGARHRCRFVLADPRQAGVRLVAKSSASVSIRQLYQGIEVGRITWTLPLRRAAG